FRQATTPSLDLSSRRDDTISAQDFTPGILGGPTLKQSQGLLVEESPIIQDRSPVCVWRGLLPSPRCTCLEPSLRPGGPAVSSPGREAGERGHPPRKRSEGPAHTSVKVSVLR